MICAINPIPMAHQWRKEPAPLLIGALREKGNGASASITLSPTAHQWRNLAAECSEINPPRGGIEKLPRKGWRPVGYRNVSGGRPR